MLHTLLLGLIKHLADAIFKKELKRKRFKDIREELSAFFVDQDLYKTFHTRMSVCSCPAFTCARHGRAPCAQGSNSACLCIGDPPSSL